MRWTDIFAKSKQIALREIRNVDIVCHRQRLRHLLSQLFHLILKQ